MSVNPYFNIISSLYRFLRWAYISFLPFLQLGPLCCKWKSEQIRVFRLSWSHLSTGVHSCPEEAHCTRRSRRACSYHWSRGMGTACLQGNEAPQPHAEQGMLSVVSNMPSRWKILKNPPRERLTISPRGRKKRTFPPKNDQNLDFYPSYIQNLHLILFLYPGLPCRLQDFREPTCLCTHWGRKNKRGHADPPTGVFSCLLLELYFALFPFRNTQQCTIKYCTLVRPLFPCFEISWWGSISGEEHWTAAVLKQSTLPRWRL